MGRQCRLLRNTICWNWCFENRLHQVLLIAHIINDVIVIYVSIFRTGKRTPLGAIKDGYNSAIRYYYNNFADGFRQVRGRGKEGGRGKGEGEKEGGREGGREKGRDGEGERDDEISIIS